MTSPTPPRLTELARLAGCAAKAGPAVVEAALRQVTAHMDDGKVPEGLSLHLLVGLAPPDDAAANKITDDQAIVVTVDFFAPIVDDLYCHGAIAAAYAMSDVYAMGGEVVLALNIAAFPMEMDEQTITEILRGGTEKVTEAGAGIDGGHTIIDEEPKYGLAAIGLVHPDRVFTKAGTRPDAGCSTPSLIPRHRGACCSPSIRRGRSNSKTALRQPSCRCGRSAP